MAESKSSLESTLGAIQGLPLEAVQLVVQDSRCSSIEHVMEYHFSSWAANDETKQAAMVLFEEYPALAIASLIDNDILDVPTGLRSQLPTLLRANSAELNILKAPIDVLTRTITHHLAPDQNEAASRFLRSLQDLSQVIVSPTDLGPLLAGGYSSPEFIAYTPIDRFVQSVASNFLSKENAQRIHRQSVTLQTNIEQSWMAMLQGDRFQDGFVPSKPQNKDQSEQALATVQNSVTGQSSQTENSLTPETIADWFDDLDEVACEECCSVTSPAAYLVDLLRMLHVSMVGAGKMDLSQMLPALMNNEGKGVSNSLLAHFFMRRPDIGDLLLSCRNTNELVPYIDLANEVMESAIKYRNKNSSNSAPIKIDAFNADDHAFSNHGLDCAQNTQADVYEEYVSTKVFPSHIFPFEHGRISLECYVGMAGLTLAEIREAFWPWTSEQKPSESDGKWHDALGETLIRAQAADVLGLSNLDYVALTDEGIWNPLVVQSGSSDVEYSDNKPLPRPIYWGYQGDKAETEMLDYKDKKGLPYIRKQLLPRLEVDFVTLCDILNSNFLAKALRVSLIEQDKYFDPDDPIPTHLNDFRLVGRDGAPLDIESCHRLAQFVRIWQRLNWSVAEVDDALSRFGVIKDNLIHIAPGTIEELAALQDLVKTTQWTPKLIIALWNSNSSHLRELLGFRISKSDSSENSETSKDRLASTLAFFLATTEMTYEDYMYVKTSQQLGDDLEPQTIFALYRAQSLSKMFGIAVPQTAPLLKMLEAAVNIYSSPKSLLNALKRWQHLQSVGWNYQLLKDVMADPLAPSGLLTPMQKSSRLFIGRALKTLIEFEINAHLNSTKPAESSSEGDKDKDKEKEKETKVKLQTTLARLIESDLAAILPKSDSEILKFLLNEKLDGEKKSAFTIILDELMSTSVATDPPTFLLRTGSYIISNEPCEVLFSCTSNQLLQGTAVAGTPTIDVSPASSAISAKLEKGILTLIQSTSDLGELTVSVKPPNNENATLARLSAKSIDLIEATIGKLNKLAIISNRNGLSAADLAVLFGSNKIEWTESPFEKAYAYYRVRENFRLAARKFDFPRFVRTLTEPSKSVNEFAEELGQVTTLSSVTIEALLHLISESEDAIVVKQTLAKRSKMERFANQLAILSRLGLGPEAIELLCQFVKPRTKDKQEKAQSAPDSQDKRPVVQLAELIKAAQLGKGKTATVRNVEDKLRVQRRRALVAYLLQDPYFKDKGIADADGLFEFFLIDVQMGACLETSRIKQAISTVQLFVQRCLLGLEPGIDSDVVDRGRWAWMQKYNLWEANRKVFLYPENWADPTLRDNKTELFKTIETAIMQTNLDEKAIEKMIRAYVYDAEEVANLRIESYLWDRRSGDSASEGVYHFFARTRNEPFQYFYRRLSYITNNSLAMPLWNAWEKIALEVSPHGKNSKDELLSDPGTYMVPACWNHRLFLFLPQVSKSIQPKKGSSNMTMEQNSTGNTMNIKLPSETTSPDINVEIKMSWSEYTESTWSPPVQAQQIIQIKNCSDTTIFRFLVDENSAKLSNLSVYVLRCDTDGKEPRSLSVGRFELQGTRLVQVESSSLTDANLQTLAFAPATGFSRHSSTLSVEMPAEARPKYDRENKALRLAKPRIYTDKADGKMTWTLNGAVWATGSDVRPLGLVVDIPTLDGVGNETWFTLPEFANPDQNDDFFNDELSTTLYNPVASKLGRSTIGKEGLDGIFCNFDQVEVGRKTGNAPKDAKTATRKAYQQNLGKLYEDAFGLFNQMKYCNERATPSAIYNWELGFHLVAFIVERLMSLQQFDLAIKYSRLVFDPTLKAKGQNVWRFPPFRDSDTRVAGTADSILKKLGKEEDEEKSSIIVEWENNPFSPHIVARSRPLAYMKRFVMKLIEALVASGDTHFRQSSLESIPMAIQRYVEASHILGASLQKVPKVGQVKFTSYNKIAEKIDDFSNAVRGCVLALPYIIPGKDRGKSPTQPGSSPGWARTLYFGVQANPEFASLRALVNDRLTKIRNCQDIDGKPRKLALFDPPIDPGAAVAAVASKAGLSSVLDTFSGSLPRQRFQYLLQKAIELCSDLKQMTTNFLTALEKKESEALQMLRAVHDTQIQTFLIDMRTKQITEVECGIKQLEETRKSAETRLKFYSALTGDTAEIPAENADFSEIILNIQSPNKDDPLRLDLNELIELSSADESKVLNALAINEDFWAAILGVIPMPSLNVQPMGLGVSMTVPNPAEIFRASAASLRARAGLLMEDSQRGSRMAQFTRQLHERRLQINLAGREIKSIDKQIATQKAHIEVIKHDLLAQTRQAENAETVEKFLQSKFTREELYGWLEGSTRSLMYQTYVLAMEVAKKAEQAFIFDSGNPKQSFIRTAGYWDDGRHGLDAGEHLGLALKRMDLAYNEGKFHDYEISKDISLRQLSAKALLDLRETGTATFSLREPLFDLDFPGHYRRRLKAVAVSIHCLAGPYTSSNATLTLTSHSQRIDESIVKGYPQLKTGDTRFSGDQIKIPITAVAISSGQVDSGVFELDFRTNSYQPFEGAGAISSWQLEMPAQHRQFDYHTISDVVLHLRYTSKGGSTTFREAAVANLTTYLKDTEKMSERYGLHTLINIRSDYPDGWVPFARSKAAADIRDRSSKVVSNGLPASASVTASTKCTRQVSLSKLRDHVPFFTRSLALTVEAITVYVAFSGAKPTHLHILPPQGAAPPVGPPDEVEGSLILEAQEAKSKIANMVMFQWRVDVNKPTDKNRATVGALPNLLPLSLTETPTLDLVTVFDKEDPGHGLQAMVVLEYKAKG